MRKTLLLTALIVGAFAISGATVAKADHLRGCAPGWGRPSVGFNTYSYGYTPRYFSYEPVYNYGPGYVYQPSPVYYSRPGLSISIGSGYRGYGYGGYGGYGYGGGGRGHHHHHHH